MKTFQNSAKLARRAGWAAATLGMLSLAVVHADDQRGKGPRGGNPNREKPTIGAPEIEPALAASALTLLAGGVLIMTSRRRKAAKVEAN